LKYDDQMPSDDEHDETERLNARFGPFFTRARVKQLLNITDVELDRLVTAHRLLAPVTAEGIQVFPKFQFDTEQNLAREHLRPLLKILLGSGADPWTVIYWLTAPLPEFEHQRAVDIIDRDEKTRAMLFAMAREDVGRWHAAGIRGNTASGNAN